MSVCENCHIYLGLLKVVHLKRGVAFLGGLDLGLWPKNHCEYQKSQIINLGKGNQTYIEVLGLNVGLWPKGTTERIHPRLLMNAP